MCLSGGSLKINFLIIQNNVVSLPTQRVTFALHLNLYLVERDLRPLFFFAHTDPRAEIKDCRRYAGTPSPQGGFGGYLCAAIRARGKAVRPAAQRRPRR